MSKKELFIEIIDLFKNGYDADETEFAKFKNVFEVNWQCSITNRHFDLIIKLIEELFQIERHWIEWFCFDNDFGKNKFYCKYKSENKEYVISSAADLWDFVKKSNLQLTNHSTLS